MRAVIYARYSDANQREESIEGQIRENTEYAKRKGYKVVKHYIDRAISGERAENRPEFLQMIEDSKKGLFDAVIVWKTDRFARDKYDSTVNKYILKKNSVAVLFATEPMIDDTPEGQLMECFMEAFAVYYLADLKQKVRRGMTENAIKGKYNGGSITFGYMLDKERHVHIDPKNAPITVEIFMRYASGEPIKDILKDLVEKGLKNSRGSTPTYSFITSILKNRKYLGEYTFLGKSYDGFFPQLIDADIFEKCQKRLASNQLKPGHFKPVEEKYILSGKIFCGYCGTTMCGESGKSSTGAIYRYYHCRAAKKQKTCNKKRVMKDFIETAVVDMAMQLFDDKPLLDRVVDNCYNMQTRISTQLPALERQLKQTLSEIKNVMKAIKKGIITVTTKEELEKLEQDKETLEISIAKERIERPVISKEQIMFWLSKLGATNLDDADEVQRLIDVFVSGVYVYDDKMVVTFNYEDGEKFVTFDEVNAMLEQKKNPDNLNNYQSSTLESFTDPYETRTRVAAVKGRSLNRLTNGPDIRC